MNPESRPKAALPPYATELPVTPFNAPPGTWTLVVLPDTQNMTDHHPQVFDRQCHWIAAHRRSHHILFVAHEGDITNDNEPAQWQNAKRSIDILLHAGIPYALANGNHDIGQRPRLGEDRTTLLNDYFHESDYRSSPTHALFEPGQLQNSWHAFDTPTGKFLIVALECAPRDIAVEWAGQIVANHPRHQVIILTHTYLYSDSTRYNWTQYGSEQKWSIKASPGLINDGNANDGQDLWEKLISPPPNIRLTLNGHVLNNGTGHLISRAADGHPVHQLLANYQAEVRLDDGAGGTPWSPGLPLIHRAHGGGGFLRLLQFHPDATTVSVKTYSPWYDRWLTPPDQQFTLNL